MPLITDPKKTPPNTLVELTRAVEIGNLETLAAMNFFPHSFNQPYVTYWTLKNNPTFVPLAAEKQQHKILEYILANGGNPNAVDAEGQSALHYVAKDVLHKEKLFNILIKAGADINLRDYLGNTPLHCAINSNTNFNDFSSLYEILKFSPNTQIQNLFGETPLDIARKKNKKVFATILENYQQLAAQPIGLTLMNYIDYKQCYEGNSNLVAELRTELNELRKQLQEKEQQIEKLNFLKNDIKTLNDKVKKITQSGPKLFDASTANKDEIIATKQFKM